VESCCGLGAAREHEALQLRQLGVVLVAERLELVDHRLRRAEAVVGACERDGEVGADVEELVLHALERRAQRVRQLAGKDDAEQRVQLVDDPVRADARVELRRARAVAEARLARVAATRVDLRQADGLVPVACHAS
jgi:hypothetical protein